MAVTVEPADLTPAVDKYVCLPPRSKLNVESFYMTARGPTPKGPEPFNLVADELQPLSDYVKELVVSENPVLTMAASHFFEQVNMVNELFSTQTQLFISSAKAKDLDPP